MDRNNAPMTVSVNIWTQRADTFCCESCYTSWF